MLVNYAVAAALFVSGIWIYAIRQGMGNLLDAARGWFANLQKVPDVKSKLLLVSCWLLCPIMLPFVLSMVIRPMYLDRYTISAAPALYLLLALGIFSIRKLVPIIISLGILVIMIAPSLDYYYMTDIHEQLKEAAAYVDENSKPDEVIVFTPNKGIGIQQKTFDWYYKGALQGCGLPNRLIDPIAISEALVPCISWHTRFWVIISDYLFDPSIPHYRLYFLNSNQTAMHLIKEHQFVKISVYLFELTK